MKSSAGCPHHSRHLATLMHLPLTLFGRTLTLMSCRNNHHFCKHSYQSTSPRNLYIYQQYEFCPFSCFERPSSHAKNSRKREAKDLEEKLVI